MKTFALTLRLSLCIAALLPFSRTAHAQYTGPDARVPVNTAAAASKAADDTPVVLEGNLVRQLSGDTFEFRDASGSVTVEIDAEDLPAQKIDAATKVRLRGEVDRDWRTVEIDVKRVEIL